jgi:hypothetical protein
MNVWPVALNRNLKSSDVIYVLSNLFVLRGVPEHIPKPCRNVLRRLVQRVPTSRWAAHEIMALSHSTPLYHKLLYGEIYYSLNEARIGNESWRRQRPKSSCPRRSRGLFRNPGELRRPRRQRGRRVLHSKGTVSEGHSTSAAISSRTSCSV